MPQRCADGCTRVRTLKASLKASYVVLKAITMAPEMFSVLRGGGGGLDYIALNGAVL